MLRPPPRSPPTDPLFPYATLFRSATAVTPARAADPIGTPPADAGEHVVPALPNADAFEVTAWVPDLDRGDVPQGLAVLGEHVLVAAYREREGNQDCRIHRFAAATGAHAGSVDLPAPCSHAGGQIGRAHV